MIQVGDVFTHTFSFTQDQVNTFAEVTGDTNPLHVNEEAGRNSIFGRNIVHGHLSQSVFTKIFGTLLHADGHIYMMQKSQFYKPMFTEKEYEAIITVKEIFPEKNRILYETKIIEKDTGDVTVNGEAMLMNKKVYVW